MKTLLSLIVLALTTIVASAQPFLSQNFLAVQSLNVSNTLAISNITSFAGMTNILGVTWTNLSGTRQTVTTAGDSTRLLKDAVLWTDREGRPMNFFTVNPIQSAYLTNSTIYSPLTVFLRLHGGSGANSAVTFVFQPLWDGVTAPINTTDDWSVALTATTSTVVDLATNVPLWRWPGAAGLRLKSIVNGDTDATSQITVTKCSINGFRP